jgi:hypothetical protein
MFDELADLKQKQSMVGNNPAHEVSMANNKKRKRQPARKVSVQATTVPLSPVEVAEEIMLGQTACTSGMATLRKPVDQVYRVR